MTAPAFDLPRLESALGLALLGLAVGALLALDLATVARNDRPPRVPALDPTPDSPCANGCIGDLEDCRRHGCRWWRDRERANGRRER